MPIRVFIHMTCSPGQDNCVGGACTGGLSIDGWSDHQANGDEGASCCLGPPLARGSGCEIACNIGSGSMLVQTAADLCGTEQTGTEEIEVCPVIHCRFAIFSFVFCPSVW